MTGPPVMFDDGTPIPERAPGEVDTSHETLVDRETQRILARRDAEAKVRAMYRPAIPPSFMLRDLLAQPMPDVRYRIDGLWPAGGRVVLAAQAKTGKTTMRDNLIRSLVDGQRFLDKFYVNEPAEAVALIDAELAQPTLQLWLREQGIRNDNRLRIWPLRGSVASFDILDDQCRALWAKQLRGAQVLIVDCLGPLLAAFGLDESKNPEVGRWLAGFDSLLDEAGIPEALIVHHMGYAAERSRGASRLQDWPDAMWKLLREEPKPGVPTDPTRYFAADGRDVAVREGAVRYDPIDRHLSLTGGSRSAAKTERDVPIVVDYVRDHPDLCKTDIETALSDELFTRRRVRDALAAGLRGGLLVEIPGPRNRKNIGLPAQSANSPQPASLFGEFAAGT